MMNPKTKSPREYLSEPYTRILFPDSGGEGFTAQILEFPGCVSQGETVQEAYANLEDAALAWIEAALELGQEIPQPAESEGYRGKIALRLPRSLHRQAALMAKRDGVSLNHYIVAAIAEKLGATRTIAYLQPSSELKMASAPFGILFTAGTISKIAGLTWQEPGMYSTPVQVKSTVSIVEALGVLPYRIATEEKNKSHA